MQENWSSCNAQLLKHTWYKTDLGHKPPAILAQSFYSVDGSEWGWRMRDRMAVLDRHLMNITLLRATSHMQDPRGKQTLHEDWRELLRLKQLKQQEQNRQDGTKNRQELFQRNTIGWKIKHSSFAIRPIRNLFYMQPGWKRGNRKKC